MGLTHNCRAPQIEISDRRDVEPIPTRALQNRAALPVDRTTPGVARAGLVAAAGTATVGGERARMLLYGGRLPGPVLRIREGERVELQFTNRLEEPTSGTCS